MQGRSIITAALALAAALGGPELAARKTAEAKRPRTIRSHPIMAAPYGTSTRGDGKDAERITAALVRQSIRAIKRQRDYDYSIIRNHCNRQFVKVEAYNRIMERQNAARHQKLEPSSWDRWGTCTGRVPDKLSAAYTPKQARYIGDKKKLAGKTALIRPAVGIVPSGVAVRAQFDDLELTWRGTNLAQGWHVFDANEFEVLNGEETEG